MSTPVSIHLSKELDAGLRHSTGASGKLGELIAQYGLELQPLFPGTRESASERIWQVACAEHEAAEILEKLAATPGVEAAYLKPPDELPGPS